MILNYKSISGDISVPSYSRAKKRVLLLVINRLSGDLGTSNLAMENVFDAPGRNIFKAQHYNVNVEPLKVEWPTTVIIDRSWSMLQII